MGDTLRDELLMDMRMLMLKRSAVEDRVRCGAQGLHSGGLTR